MNPEAPVSTTRFGVSGTVPRPSGNPEPRPVAGPSQPDQDRRRPRRPKEAVPGQHPRRIPVDTTGAKITAASHGRRRCPTKVPARRLPGGWTRRGRVGFARLRRIQHAFDDEGRSPLYLLVHLREVGTDDAECRQLNSTQKQDEQDHSGEPRRGAIRTDDPNCDGGDTGERAAYYRDDRRHGDELERSVRERENALARPPKVAHERNSWCGRTFAPVVCS